MEDLGNINITIREGGGGGGGGGGVPGGGPSVAPPQPSGRDGDKQSFLDTLRGAFGEFGGVVKAPGIDSVQAMLKPDSNLMRALTQMIGPESGFAKALAGMAGEGSALGRVLAAVGSLAVPVGVALAALAATIGGVLIAFKLLSAAAAATAERIEAVGRYSGDIATAQARERMAALTRTIAEAQRNALAYSVAQDAATKAADAWSPVLITARRVTSVFAIGFNEISRQLADAISYAISTVVGAIQTILSIPFVQSILGTDSKTAGMLSLMVHYLFNIDKNTKPKATSVNQWFLDDIKAMTGRAY